MGDLPAGDLLVEDDRIAAIGSAISAEDVAGTVAASGCTVTPGLVNAHMHTWQTALRGVAANWTLLESFRKMHAGLATAFTPEDLFIATRMGVGVQDPGRARLTRSARTARRRAGSATRPRAGRPSARGRCGGA